jgi:hypothetical protein
LARDLLSGTGSNCGWVTGRGKVRDLTIPVPKLL